MSTEYLSIDSLPISKTLSQSIYNSLKEAIITNKLEANQRIQEKEIAKIFGVSTTPVREAVLRLAAEGFLFIDSHRKTVVKEISYKELIDILQVLAELDAISILHVVDFIQPKDLKKLRSLTLEMEEAKRKKDVDRFVEMNTAIHKTIWDILPNKILQRTLEFVHGQLMRYTYSRTLAFREPGVLDRSLREHKEILQALEKKDKRSLKSLARSNWKVLIEELPKISGERGRK